MNEYLFRGKRKDNGKWIEGGYCYCDNKSYIIITTRYIPDIRDWDEADYYEENPVYEPTFIEVRPETVGQWTGLTDEGCNKIFEGDIIFKPSWWWGCRYVYLKRGKCGACKADNVMQYILSKNIENPLEEAAYNLWDGNEVKVIGNIYDNPELLEEV